MTGMLLMLHMRLQMMPVKTPMLGGLVHQKLICMLCSSLNRLAKKSNQVVEEIQSIGWDFK